MTTVSVILPVYNAEHTVGRAIQSILDQTHHDLELIIVNDGSTDSTLEVLNSFRDSRIRLLDREHLGVAAASNTGFSVCQSPVVARMDADDWSFPERLELQLGLLHSLKLDVVGSQVRILDDQDQPVPSMARYEDWINRETLRPDTILENRFVELPIVNPTILARREYFEYGFHENDFPEDYDLFLRAAEVGTRFGKVEKPLHQWYESPTRLTRRDPRYSDQAFDRCRKHYLRRGPLASIAAVDVWGAGKTGKSWIKWLQQVGIPVRRCFDVSSRKIGQMIHGIRIQAADELTRLDENPLLIAVGSQGARDLMRPHLRNCGYQSGENAWFVA